MLRIPCPHCGLRDYTEFHYAGDATKLRPAHGTDDRAASDDRAVSEGIPSGEGTPSGGDLRAWHDYVFLFDNPKGAHLEYWQHVEGCRQWLVLERDTATNTVGRSWLARNRVTEQSHDPA
jgi:sarcosine oxidase subunit delta